MADLDEKKTQVRRGGYGWSLAALIMGLLPLPVAFAVAALPRPAKFYALPASGALFGLCAVVCGVIAIFRPRRRLGMALTGLVLGAGWLAMASVSLPATPRSLAHLCLTNVQALAQGVGMYATDSNDFLPPADTWPVAILPYVKNTSLYACPVDGSRDPRGKPMDAAFSFNRYLSLQPVSRAAGFPLLFDGRLLIGDKMSAVYRHSGGLNVSYVDGHAQWMSRQAFLDGSVKPKPPS
jgi:prepilin-type processing-associated H-X9-DG protein